jgi:hypothetical protein
MRMHKGKIIGGGVTLAGTAVGLYASGWPEYIRLHPLLPLIVLLSGMAFVVWGLFIPGGKGESSNISKAFVGGDNSGQQVSAAGDVHFHLPPPNSSKVEDAASRPIREPSPQPLPHLKLRDCRLEIADLSHFADFGERSRRLLYVINVENVLPDRHEPIITARGLSVDLRFTGAYGLQGHISRAFWYEKSFNQVDLRGGEECGFIVGEINAGSWVCNDNCRDRLMSYEESQLAALEGDASEVKSVKIPIVHGAPITVEIKIFSNRLERVLLDERFRIIPVTKDAARMERIK